MQSNIPVLQVPRYVDPHTFPFQGLFLHSVAHYTAVLSSSTTTVLRIYGSLLRSYSPEVEVLHSNLEGRLLPINGDDRHRHQCAGAAR
jgi:hypothetical protein